MLCRNDYLGYAMSSRLLQGEALGSEGGARSGAGASRLVQGDTPEHRSLELAVADWVGQESALVFTSGYAANVGLLSSLARAGDRVISDALNHASIVDGCRLSRAELVVVPHRNVSAFEQAVRSYRGAGRCWVITESYFSMDGDLAPIAALRDITSAHGAGLLLDEAHALGVLGPEGRGAAALAGVSPDALVGTFGKAIGGQGAFVAGPAILIDWLWNRARSFVFSTGISPLLASLDLRGVLAAREDDLARERLAHHSECLRRGLRELGLPLLESVGPILPILLGTDALAVQCSTRLAQEGVLVTAIRPPTVPEGAARLRVTAHATLTENEIERALAAFATLKPLLPSETSQLPQVKQRSGM